jgi:hypothetical protein
VRVVALLALAAVLTGAALLLDRDREPVRTSGLVWAARPRIAAPPSLPADRVLYGQVRNDGPRTLELTASHLRVVDAAGRALASDGRFLQAYAPRAGRVLALEPGRTAPVTVAWRGAGARRITLGDVVLQIPR